MAQPLIHIEDVSIKQGSSLVLRNIHLTVNNGEFVYLVGKTGSGKSSLLKSLYAELPVEEGVAEICGYDLTDIGRKDVPFLRRKLGIIFQDFQLLTDRSVADNLFFVLKATGWKNKSEMDARVHEVLENVGLGSKGFKFPHELSGGEQQRVSIARSLLNNPEVILADEPTGNLDDDTSEEIMNLLWTIRGKGTAVVMATHDRYILEKFPSRKIYCREGELVEFSEGI